MYNVNIIRIFFLLFSPALPISHPHSKYNVKIFFYGRSFKFWLWYLALVRFFCVHNIAPLSLSFARTSIYCCANEMYFVSLVLAAHGTIQCRLMRAWNTHAIHLAAAATDVTDSRWCRAIFTACRLVYFIEWIANENTNRTHTQATTNGAKSSLVQQQPTTSGLELAH